MPRGTGEPPKDIRKGDGIARFSFRKISLCGKELEGRQTGGMYDGENAIEII